MSQTIVVTGAAGFVGHHLLDHLHQLGGDDTIVAWHRPGATDGPGRTGPPREHPAEGRVRWRAVDLLDRDTVARELGETAPTQVYHCAGVANVGGSWSNNYATLRVNVLGTEHLFAGLRLLDQPARVLIPGSALVYRPSSAPIDETAPLGPVSPYGLSKLAQEMLGMAAGEQDGAEVILTRSFTHVGPGQAPSYAASSFAQQLVRIEAGLCEPVLAVGNLDAQRDLTDVRDTVRAYRLLMSQGAPHTPYNVCSGVAHRIGAILDGLLAQVTAEVTIRQDPARARPSDNPLLLGDPTRLADRTGWTAEIPLERTLADMLDYWRGVIART